MTVHSMTFKNNKATRFTASNARFDCKCQFIIARGHYISHP